MTNEIVDIRVLIVAEHASAKFGGEAILPLHYYRVLRQRKIPTWLIVHERTRLELEALFPKDDNRIVFVSDTVFHCVLWRCSRFLPARLASFTTGFVMRLVTQLAQLRVIRQLVHDEKISVIHQPTPVSPKEPSMIYGTGVPVVIGPMNGGIDYPHAFRRKQGQAERFTLAAGRRLSAVMNHLIPGKRQAAILLVANERTRKALPLGVCNRVVTLVENGVDLALWKSSFSRKPRSPSEITRYALVGRLIDWKAVDLLLLAFKRASMQALMSLTIVGDGIERKNLEQLAGSLGLLDNGAWNQPGKVSFCGWMSQAQCAEQLQQCDVLVLPSLMECGGAVVLEAMAMEIPVIATAWGGPADYLDSSCGILVEPTSKDAFIENLASALIRLATFPQEQVAMGKAGRAKVIRYFDWNVKVDHILELYKDVIASNSVDSRDT